jgi:hypothetical protein
MAKTPQRRSLRLPAALYDTLVAVATTKACTMPRLLHELLDLAAIVTECERIEVTFPQPHDGRPVVKVWMPQQQENDG